MDYTISISLITGYVLILILSTYTVIQIFQHRDKYGTQLIAFLNIANTFIAGILYSTFFIFSVVVFISHDVNILMWKISLVTGFITLLITSIIYSFFNEYKKIKPFPFVYFTLLFGLLLGALATPDSIALTLNGPFPPMFSIMDPSNMYFEFDVTTSIVFILFELFITIYFLYSAAIIYNKTKNKNESSTLLLNTVVFSISVIMLLLYITVQDTLYREIYIVILWVSSFAFYIMLIKKPEMFFILPNRIYSVNIYHKSGIVLYSYNFGDTADNKIESARWGTILIGLNHILSEFIDKTDKIDVIQTKKSDIVVRYENELGYALVVITNQKNEIVENLMLGFSQDFNSKYKNKLLDIQDLNRLINISEFFDIKELIEKHFQLYT
ncbi:MAG: hypothetical protein KGD72_09150 [Candidatus Lokiarchaeota archaeon]|nr:hypothetical protein [Candidatus Lokiarchaeota archaeon]